MFNSPHNGFQSLPKGDTEHMTQLPQPPPDLQVVPDVKPQHIIPFDTHITFATPLRVVPGGMELQIDGHPVIVELHPSIVLKVQETPPEQGRIYTVVLWFEMHDTEVQTLILARFHPAKGLKAEKTKPVFRIAARLMDASSKDHLMLLQVEPNAKGGLSEAFLVHVWARTPLLRSLPERHRTVVASGRYEHANRRLVATGFNSFLVGPRDGTEGLSIENSSVRLAVPDQDVNPESEVQNSVPAPEVISAPAQAKTAPEAVEHTNLPAPAHARAVLPGQEAANPKRLRAPKP